jgi:hypothetical protein
LPKALKAQLPIAWARLYHLQVLILKSSGNLIIAYASSDNKGNYTLQIPAEIDKTGLNFRGKLCWALLNKAKPVASAAAKCV